MKQVGCLCCFLLVALSLADEPRDYASFVRALADLDRLPLLDNDLRTKQASSYDRESRYDATTDTYARWDAGGDSGKYARISLRTGESTMVSIKGAGCITRIWSANPQGKIRFYLDGAKTPLEFEFEKFLSGKLAPFLSPFVWQRKTTFAGDGNPAGVCYLPIPFAESCKIAAEKNHNQFYSIGYQLFPEGTKVATFNSETIRQWGLRDATSPLDDVARAWKNAGADPQPKISAKTVERKVELVSGQELELKRDEAATIVFFGAKIESAEKHAGRKLWLKIFWDGEEQPSVDTPLGDFFGGGAEGKPYRSLPMGITAEGGYSYWRMPFHKGARIVVINEGAQPAKVTIRLSVMDGAPAAGAGTFHAKWRCERECKNLDYPILEAKGRGKFVGAALAVDNIFGGSWFDGDEKISVDGEKVPSLFGVSTDGFFNQGNNSLRTAEHPLFGAQKGERATAAWRWFISDSISFQQSFRLTIENQRWLDHPRNDYASVAYWYAAQAGAADFFQPTKLADRLPRSPRIEPESQEAEEIVGGATIIENDEFSWGKGVALAGKKGKRFAMMVKVEADDRYAFETGLGPRSDPNAIEFWFGGERVGRKVMLPAGKHEFWVRLTRDVTEDAPVVLDYVRLGPWRNFVRDWVIIGSFDNAGDKGFDTAYPPEKELVWNKIYSGKGNAPVSWQPARSKLSGLIDFLEVLPEPHNDTIAYAAATIIAPVEKTYDVLVGSDDAVKLWVNGQLVHSNHIHRGASPDQDTVRVKLNAGKNTFLVKVDQGGGGWGFFLRIMDDAGELQFGLPVVPATAQ